MIFSQIQTPKEHLLVNCRNPEDAIALQAKLTSFKDVAALVTVLNELPALKLELEAVTKDRLKLLKKK